LDQDTAVIGADSDDLVYPGAGAVFVFTRSGTKWAQEARLAANDPAPSDGFGFSVSVGGGTAVIGAPFHDMGAGLWSGTAYVFARSGGGWTQTAELTASDEQGDDRLGYSVSVDGPTVDVGAPGRMLPGTGPGAGVAYVFDGAIGGADQCYIGGTLYAPGDVNPANACQACQPASSTTAWSTVNEGGPCDDGNTCTLGDTCQGGLCAGANASDGTACDDGNACTLGDTCQGGTCAGSYAPDGTACDDGNPCTLGDACQGGVCAGTSVVQCPPAIDVRCGGGGICDIATGA